MVFRCFSRIRTPEASCSCTLRITICSASFAGGSCASTEPLSRETSETTLQWLCSTQSCLLLHCHDQAKRVFWIKTELQNKFMKAAESCWKLLTMLLQYQSLVSHLLLTSATLSGAWAFVLSCTLSVNLKSYEKMMIRTYKPTPTNMFLTHSQSLKRLQSNSCPKQSSYKHKKNHLPQPLEHPCTSCSWHRLLADAPEMHLQPAQLGARRSPTKNKASGTGPGEADKRCRVANG